MLLTTTPVICRKCGKPAEDISHETSYEYAYHPRCRPWDRSNQEREKKKQEFFASKKVAKS